MEPTYNFPSPFSILLTIVALLVGSSKKNPRIAHRDHIVGLPPRAYNKPTFAKIMMVMLSVGTEDNYGIV